MSDRLTDEELAEIRGRSKYATQGELQSKTNVYTDKISLYDEDGQEIAEGMDCFNARFFYHARTDIPRLLDEVERLLNRVAQMEDDALTESSEMAIQMDMAEMKDELTRLTDQAQRDAGKIEVLAEEVDRLRTGTCVQRLVYDLNDEELRDDRDRIDGLRGIYTSKVEYAIDLAVAAIDDELLRRKVEATNE